jgi:hypothetical protein
MEGVPIEDLLARQNFPLIQEDQHVIKKPRIDANKELTPEEIRRQFEMHKAIVHAAAGGPPPIIAAPPQVNANVYTTNFFLGGPQAPAQ